ncbi:peptidase M24 [Suillus subalutaceus]|uniref:peptidase M24 n=1 Tax=Suillus subalutaceus TaxID=48586 RepID=UPI001B87F064|nr:peptidase M24 [Suillus subalutaceus]KAG1875383.1 peptidase M24 [Suillus subalutaceus]
MRSSFRSLLPALRAVAARCPPSQICTSSRTYATEAVPDYEHKPSHYGQPLFQSHPHLLRPNELTPGIPSEEYERRRKELMDSLPSNSVVVLIAAPVKYMSGRLHQVYADYLPDIMASSYKYRQGSDFWYLTGFEEPDSAVVLEKNASSRGYRMTLFSNGKDSAKEKWDGPRTGFDDALNVFKADDALTIKAFPAQLRSMISLYSNVYIDLPQSPRKNARSTKSLLRYLSPPVNPRSEYETVVESLSSSRRKPLAPLIAQLRAFKSICEQQVMRMAADISGRAHAKTMRFTRPGISESALAAHFEYLCSLSGSQRLAYVPVVASGPNALIIHYTSNNQVVQDGEMILMDAGCEYNGYASDITRTYPVNGSFTPPQKELYSAVLSAQKALVGQELKQIGFTLHTGDLERVLYPHFLSHPIGIDLHESSYSDRGELCVVLVVLSSLDLEFTFHARLKAGMVITVEPGIYVPPTAQFPKHFHNIGIRIEDEVLVGEKHPVVLSVSAPKEIADIEGACQGLLGLEPI